MATVQFVHDSLLVNSYLKTSPDECTVPQARLRHSRKFPIYLFPILTEKRSESSAICYIYIPNPILRREQMAQPTLSIPSGAAKISFFDRTNVQKMTFASENRFFLQRNVQFRSPCIRPCMEVQAQSSPPWWRNHGETIIFDLRFLACQYVNILPILRERSTRQYSRSILTEFEINLSRERPLQGHSKWIHGSADPPPCSGGRRPLNA